MSGNSDPTLQTNLPRLGTGGALLRFALIGATLAAVVATFAYLGRWFSPNELTPSRFADGFESVAGIHHGFRRNHAKGLGVAGFFESNGNADRLSKAVVFLPGRLSVIGRFSLSGGNPDVADLPDTVRGLGLEFSLPNGELWRTAMVNLPIFPVKTPQAFYEQLIATKPDPKTGKPDPALQKSFLAKHPDTERTMKVIKGRAVSSGFGNSTFHGLNAFRFTNSAGDVTPVRWWLKPEQPFTTANAAATEQRKNYLFETLIADLHRQPLHWRLIIIVGKPSDPTDDASIAWPESREQVDAGTLTLDRAESDETSAATDINFDPLVLPSGISASDDPLLSARSAVYSQSFTRREGEAKQPSAIPSADLK